MYKIWHPTQSPRMLSKAARGKKHVAAEVKLISGASYKKVNRSKVVGLDQKNVSYITPFIDWTNGFWDTATKMLFFIVSVEFGVFFSYSG